MVGFALSRRGVFAVVFAVEALMSVLRGWDHSVAARSLTVTAVRVFAGFACNAVVQVLVVQTGACQRVLGVVSAAKRVESNHAAIVALPGARRVVEVGGAGIARLRIAEVAVCELVQLVSEVAAVRLAMNALVRVLVAVVAVHSSDGLTAATCRDIARSVEDADTCLPLVPCAHP